MLQRPQAQASLHAGPGSRLGRARGRRTPADCVPVAATDPLYILYTSGTTGDPEGHRPRQRRPSRRPHLEHAQHLRGRAGRGVLGRVRSRVGGGPLLHRLRPAVPREHHRALRGKAGRHARSRRLLASHRPARGPGVLHRADGVPRHPARRSRRRARPPLRSRAASHAVSGRRAVRSRDARAGPRSSSGSR